MNWIDGLSVTFVISLSFIGGSRGLLDQLARAIPTWGTLIVVMITQSFWTPLLKPIVPSPYRSTGALVLGACISYPILLFLMRFFISRLHATPLGYANRWGGALLGACQGVLWLLAIGFALWWTPIANDRGFYKSFIGQQTYPYVQSISKKYVWRTIKTQPKTWWDIVRDKIKS